MRNENKQFLELTIVKKLVINGWTGYSKLLSYGKNRHSLLMPNRDAEFLNVIDVSDPEDASIILKWTDAQALPVKSVDCTSDNQLCYVVGEKGITIIPMVIPTKLHSHIRS